MVLVLVVFCFVFVVTAQVMFLLLYKVFLNTQKNQERKEIVTFPQPADSFCLLSRGALCHCHSLDFGVSDPVTSQVR